MTANAFPARAFPKRAFPGRAFPAVVPDEEQTSGGWIREDDIPWMLRPVERRKDRPILTIETDAGKTVEVRPTPAPIDTALAAQLLVAEISTHFPDKAEEIATELLRRKNVYRKRRAQNLLPDDEWLLILVAAGLL